MRVQEGNHPSVPGEISGIECQQVRYAVTQHRSHQSGIVCGLPANLVLRNQIPPKFENGAFVAEQAEQVQDVSQVAQGIGRFHAKAVAVNRPRRDGVILVTALRDDDRIVATPAKLRERRKGDRMVRVIGLRRSQQDVRIAEDEHQM